MSYAGRVVGNSRGLAMSDLRARLAEAHWDLYVSQARELLACSHIPDTFTQLGENEQGYHYRYADVLLSLPGIAIVELPEPATASVESDVFHLVLGGELEVVYHRTNHEGEPSIVVSGLGHFTVDEARKLAAALLAAANDAEALK